MRPLIHALMLACLIAGGLNASGNNVTVVPVDVSVLANQVPTEQREQYKTSLGAVSRLFQLQLVKQLKARGIAAQIGDSDINQGASYLLRISLDRFQVHEDNASRDLVPSKRSRLNPFRDMIPGVSLGKLAGHNTEYEPQTIKEAALTFRLDAQDGAAGIPPTTLAARSSKTSESALWTLFSQASDTVAAHVPVSASAAAESFVFDSRGNSPVTRWGYKSEMVMRFLGRENRVTEEATDVSVSGHYAAIVQKTPALAFPVSRKNPTSWSESHRTVFDMERNQLLDCSATDRTCVPMTLEEAGCLSSNSLQRVKGSLQILPDGTDQTVKLEVTDLGMTTQVEIAFTAPNDQWKKIRDLAQMLATNRYFGSLITGSDGNAALWERLFQDERQPIEIREQTGVPGRNGKTAQMPVKVITFESAGTSDRAVFSVPPGYTIDPKAIFTRNGF